MLKRTIMVFFVFMLILSLGCDTQKKGELPSQNLTGVESVDELTEQMSNIEQIAQELDFSELDNLEEDLASLDW